MVSPVCSEVELIKAVPPDCQSTVGTYYKLGEQWDPPGPRTSLYPPEGEMSSKSRALGTSSKAGPPDCQRSPSPAGTKDTPIFSQEKRFLNPVCSEVELIKAVPFPD